MSHYLNQRWSSLLTHVYVTWPHCGNFLIIWIFDSLASLFNKYVYFNEHYCLSNANNDIKEVLMYMWQLWLLLYVCLIVLLQLSPPSNRQQFDTDWWDMILSANGLATGSLRKISVITRRSPGCYCIIEEFTSVYISRCELMRNWNLGCKRMYVLINRGLIKISGNSRYHQISNIRRTKSQTINVSCLALQLFLPNQLKSGIKSRMKM